MYAMTTIPLVGVKTMALRGLCMRRRSATTASCLDGETSIACSKEQHIEHTLNLHPKDSYKQLGWKSSMSKIYICIHMCTHMYIQYIDSNIHTNGSYMMIIGVCEMSPFHHQATLYRIAGNFRGRKLSRVGRKGAFHGENFRGMLKLVA